MNPALAGVALAITIGAIVAVSVRDARTAILGLAVLLIGSPFLADPLADTLGLAARVVGAVLTFLAVDDMSMRPPGRAPLSRSLSHS